MTLCILIPAYNEAQHLPLTITNIYNALINAEIEHNILVINDHSTDNSESILQHLSQTISTLSYKSNTYGRGFGNALRFGLDNWRGEVVAIMMADASDEPTDVVRYYEEITLKKVDCVFGSRFIKGSQVHNYPVVKLLFNRAFNSILRLLTAQKFNDFTNAFKAYRRVVIEECQPFISENFSLTVEIPLKALSKGFSYSVIPIRWTQRKYGFSKLNLIKNTPSYLRVVKLFITRKL